MPPTDAPPIEHANLSRVASQDLNYLPALHRVRGAGSRSVESLAGEASELFVQGRFQPALERFAEAVRLRPDDASYHYKLACTAWKAGRLELVERHFRQAIVLDSRNPLAEEGLSQWYLESGDLAAALHHSQIARDLAPDDVDIAVSRAFVLESAGEQAAAWDILERFIRTGIRTVRLAGLYARMTSGLGRTELALDLVVDLLESPGVIAPEQPALHFAAANLLDRLGRYDQAFDQARLANVKSPSRWDPGRHAQWIDRQIDYFTPRRVRSLARATNGSPRTVFIVGMPRSGTTLLEQVLASHPSVHGAGELLHLSELMASAPGRHWGRGFAYPECLDGISVNAANELANEYLSAIAAINSSAACVTDKLPLNFLLLGMIQVLLPDSRIIHCVRDPLDTCLSCYFTNLAAGNDFTHDQSHLGLYYRDYQRLMDHWKRVLEVPILEVSYEQVVQDLEGQARRMLGFLDLPWDQRCLSFHENRRKVMTASRQQVRQPLYSSSVGRWKQYEKHLEPLKFALNGPDR